MSDLFYRAFEEKFRGSRSLIRSRLDVYRAFISPLKQIYSDARGLDLGCGRGEWLEVLQKEGIEPMGVDLDEGMLADCLALNLPAIKGDAVAYLAGLPSESQTIITAFHMVEHIPFDQLQVVVSESLRVLKPGGLLLMETPNPENITVATCNFYLDPTHQRPIPPLLLSFLPEYYGFKRTKVLRLQQSSALEQNINLGLMDVFGGVSPDYAVIAQKEGESASLALFDAAFSKEYGLPLHALTSRYDAGIKAIAQRTQDKAQQAEAKAQQAQDKAQQAEAKAQQAQDKAQQAEALSNQYLMKIHAVYVSRSWRITAPLRWFGIQVHLLRQHGAKARFRAFIKKLLIKTIAFVSARPSLKNWSIPLVNKIGITAHLRQIHRGATVMPMSISSPQADEKERQAAEDVPQQLSELTPRARQIYTDLKTAINCRRKENG